MINQKVDPCDSGMPFKPSSTKPRLGFFGGSFDPIHDGHLSVALSAVKKFELQQVLLCPAYFAPLRQEKPFFSSNHRLAMVEAASQNHTHLEVFDDEILSGKTCYTYNTLLEVNNKFPEHEIFLMIGDDQYDKFEKWKFHQNILNEFQIIVFNRNNIANGKDFSKKFPSARIHRLENPLFPHSSTEIRKRIETGKDISHLIPSPVYSHMKESNLLDSHSL